jgi:hypothetical protein
MMSENIIWLSTVLGEPEYHCSIDDWLEVAIFPARTIFGIPIIFPIFFRLF